MLGLYMPTDMKEIDMSKDRVFASLIKDLNKELGTNYTPSEVFDVDFMKDIEKKWDRIPLNLDEVMRNYNFTSSTLFRLREYKDQLKETQNLKKEQGRKDLERRKEELKKQQEWNREKRKSVKNYRNRIFLSEPLMFQAKL